MKRPIKYTDEPIKGRPIPDFLPAPHALRLRRKHAKRGDKKIPKIKPEIWTRNGGEQFVVLSMSDFEKVQDLIEDAGLARIFREAKRRNGDAAGIPLEEMKRRLGLAPSRKRKAS
jgi:hypothetical protein